MNSEEKVIDHCGRVVYTTKGLMNLIKNGRSLNNVLAIQNEETELYNKLSDNKLIFYTEEHIEQTVEEFDSIHTAKWKTPEPFCDINVYDFLINKCTTQEEIDRVNYEFKLFKERDLIPLLRHLIYLIDHFRKNKIVWGVGRGSSVSSYILYLIGCHKVNSIKYNLDIHEFLR